MLLGFLPKRHDSVELLHTSIAPSMVSSSLTACAGEGAPHFLETKIILELRNTHFQIKGIFDGKNIRLADLADASKFMIGAFRSYVISGKPPPPPRRG